MRDQIMLSTTQKLRRLLLPLLAASIATPLAIFAACYVTLSPASMAKYLLYQGRPMADYNVLDFAIHGLPKQTLSIPVRGGGSIKAFYFTRDEAPYVLLLSHGQLPLIYHLGFIKPALKNNFSALIYDYRGFGASGGTASTANMLEDGLAAFDYLVNVKKVPANKIILLGSSLGTGVTANLALKRKAAAVVLLSPYTTINRAAIDAIPACKMYPAWMYPTPVLTCLPLIKSKSNTPVILIHGTKDKSINVQNSRDLMQVAGQNCRYVELKDSPHNISLDVVYDQLNQLVRELNCASATRRRDRQLSQAG